MSYDFIAVNAYLDEIVDKILKKSIQSILIVPPDISRLDSQAGYLTQYLYKKLQKLQKLQKSSKKNIKLGILPATGLHHPMSVNDKKTMFGEDYLSMNFYNHDATNLSKINKSPSCRLLGKINLEEQEKITEINSEYFSNLWDFINIGINEKIFEYDYILSIGQIVPHEVLGMSNYHKNILIGLGCKDMIDKTHFISAVYGMEKVIAKIDNPIRQLLKHAYQKFIKNKVEIDYLFTVINKNQQQINNSSIEGLFFGNDDETFTAACKLSLEKNVIHLDKKYDRIWVKMPENKYTSTWLSNKAIYRAGGLVEDGGDLIVYAPGVSKFGESIKVDKMIRKYQYISIDEVFNYLKSSSSSSSNTDSLKNHLAVAAHLIHGYSNRYRIIYIDCKTPSNQLLSSKDYQKVGYDTLSFKEVSKKLNENFFKKSTIAYYENKKELFINDAGLGFWKN